MQLTWKAIPCKVIVFPPPVLKFMELMLLEELRVGKAPSLMGKSERLVFGLQKSGVLRVCWIQIKKLQAARFQILMTHIILQKSSVFPLISGLQAARVLFAATQRTCCTAPAVGTDLKIKPKVHEHSSASTAEKLSFWDITGWIQPLQSNTGTLHRLVSIKSRICLRNSLPSSFSSN